MGRVRPADPEERVPRLLESTSMSEIITAAIEGAGREDLLGMAMPETTRAAYVRREDSGMFEGLESEDKDPRAS